QSYYRFDHIPFKRAAMVTGLKLLLTDERSGRAWLIVNGTEVIGYTIVTFGFDLEFGGRQATVTDLYIESRYRGQGAGRKALRLIEQFCQGRGLQALELQVTRKNSAALAFYDRCGFAAHERIPMSKRIGGRRNKKI